MKIFTWLFILYKIKFNYNKRRFLWQLLVLPTKYFPTDYNLPKIIVLYSIGTILFILLLIKYKELKFDKYDFLFLTFKFLVIISTILSVDVKVSIFGMHNRYEGMLTFICYFLIYYSARYYLDVKKNSTNLVLIIL